MKKTKILLIGALLFGVPSAALSVNHHFNDATVVRAEEEKTTICELTFPDENREENKVNGYSNTWSAKSSNFDFSITNFNNYNWNSWTYIKCGSKSSASTATIQNISAIENTNIVSLTIDKITNNKVNSIKLESSLNSDFNSILETKLLEKSVGEQEISLSKNAYYYRFTFDCQKSSNGIVQISKVGFYFGKAIHKVNYVTNCDKSIDSIDVKEDNEITLPSEKLTKEGYIFDGWYTDSEFKNKFVEGTKMGTQDVTLYANWIEDTRTIYTVTFDMNDGTMNQTIEKVRENDKVTKPDNPTRAGYSFTDWHTSTDLKTTFNFETPITENITLYAGWEELQVSKYTKVTSNLDDWTGKYLIVYEKGKVCFDGSLSLNNIDSANNIKNISIENNKIIGDYKNFQFTFEKKDNGYSIKSSSNMYIGNTTKNNDLKYSVDNLYTNTISFKNNILINGEDGTTLKYNSATDQQRFRFYKSSSNQQIISLYKLEEKQEEKPTIDEKTLTSYTSTLSIDNSKAIRFIGSVKETEFNNISKIGFNFTLTFDNDKGNPISKEYSSDVTKLYKTINDNNTGTFDNNDGIYEKDGFLNFSLILKNMPKDLFASIYYYSYAVIDGKTYNSPTTEVVIAGDLIEFR